MLSVFFDFSHSEVGHIFFPKHMCEAALVVFGFANFLLGNHNGGCVDMPMQDHH